MGRFLDICRHMVKWLWIGAVLFGASWTVIGAAELEIPNPLTLEAALSFVGKNEYPLIRSAEVGLDIAQHRVRRVKQNYTPNVNLELIPRAAKRAGEREDDFFDDSRALLSLTSTIYDFGRTKARGLAALADVEEEKILLADVRQQHQINILEKFLTVLLTDTQYEISNERMTLAFLRFDRLREKRELFDEISELDVSEAETKYRELFARRTEAEIGQQEARLRLGIVLGRPGELPRDLVRPELEYWTRREPGEYRSLVEKALTANPALLAAKQRVAAAQAKVNAAKANYLPRIYSEIVLSEFATVRASRDDARASLNIEFPIFQGQRKIDVQIAGGELEQARTEVRMIESLLREEVFALTKKMLVLTQQALAARVRQRYRDAYMDRSRSLYEMEVRTDLGDAQANLLEADWYSAKTEYETAVNWARIDALLGQSNPYLKQTQ